MGLKFWAMSFALLAAALATNLQAATKVACVGNSITEGYGIWDKTKYPEHLQTYLNQDATAGRQYEVMNFGHSGRMFHKASAESYWSSDKFTAALNYGADIVVIELGTNDSKYFFDGKGSSSGYNYMYKPENKADLAKDYEALIDTFAHQPQAPTIYATLQPYAQNTEWGIVDTAIVNVINPIIKEVATKKGVKIIDLHSSFNKTEWLLDDVVHPNEVGAQELARIIAAGIQGTLSEPEATSSATEEPVESSSSAVVPMDSSDIESLHTKIAANQRISVNGKVITAENLIGEISVFDLNGNLVKRAYSNGSYLFQLNRAGAYIIKAGMNLQRIVIR